MAPRKEACYFYLSKYYLKSHKTAVLVCTVVLVEAEGAGPVSVIPEARFNIEDLRIRSTADVGSELSSRKLALSQGEHF
jgi:hypothetical protein